MNIKVFASGSGGNCMLLSDQDTHILIDAGISMRRVLSSLRAAGLDIQEISGVLITHDVAARLGGFCPAALEHMRVIPTGEDFQIGGLTVRAFHTPHDTDESVGYRVEGEGVFALATDMGHVTDEVLEGLCGADTVLIESNHDPELLAAGPYPVSLKRRILSDHGHLSNPDCAALAERLVESGTRTVILGHLSRENNRPELAMEETGRLLRGSGTRLYCAPPWGCLSVEVREKTPCST